MGRCRPDPRPSRTSPRTRGWSVAWQSASPSSWPSAVQTLYLNMPVLPCRGVPGADGSANLQEGRLPDWDGRIVLPPDRRAIRRCRVAVSEPPSAAIVVEPHLPSRHPLGGLLRRQPRPRQARARWADMHHGRLMGEELPGSGSARHRLPTLTATARRRPCGPAPIRHGMRCGPCGRRRRPRPDEADSRSLRRGPGQVYRSCCRGMLLRC